MIDKITSVFENYSTKIKNPLFGTIISIWLIHNWRIPYAIFNFDSKCTLEDKINFIADYFGKKDFWSEFVDIIGYSFLVLIFSFILLMISRAITDTYYKILEPFIVTKIDKNEIFTTAKKKHLESQIKELEDALNGKREELTRSESTNQSLILQRDRLNNEFTMHQDQTREETNKLKEQINTFRKQEDSAKRLIDKFEEVINALSSNERDSLRNLPQNYRTSQSIFDDNELTSFLVKNGYAILKGQMHELTLSGKMFLDYYDDVYNLPF